MLRILGVYKDNTQVIKTKKELVEYIDSSIENDIIAIDTETNHSLDPLTCKLMGACIYTPNEKQAYIPINHTNRDGTRLEWQLTEQDIKEQFDRLNNTKIIMHNGKFDYQVIKCTCECELDIYWDTIVGARLLNENEEAGLKSQYISKIDPSIERYSIEHLFKDIPYELVDPDIFALYAATDSYMTYKLYLYQKEIFERPGYEKLYKLFREVEIPIIFVSSYMELTGVCIDAEYSKRLSVKYHKRLDDIENKINESLNKLKPIIDTWKRSRGGSFHPIDSQTLYSFLDTSVKSKMVISGQSNGKNFSYLEEQPDVIKFFCKSGIKIGKSKAEQLDDPISLASPSQVAILLYDILGCPQVDKKQPRATGEEALKAIISKRPELDFIILTLEKRELVKLLGTYIDKLPECISVKDGRLHAHFNSLGTATGRFSSTDPNLNLWAII